MLRERGEGKTICPSEVARVLDEDWRHLMPAVRAVADQLRDKGILQITQNGKAIPSACEAKGPIRLKLR